MPSGTLVWFSASTTQRGHGQRREERHRVDRPQRWRWRSSLRGQTKWGNPFVVTDGDYARAVALYQHWLDHSDDPRATRLREDLYELAGHDLACWCPPGRPCHTGRALASCESVTGANAASRTNRRGLWCSEGLARIEHRPNAYLCECTGQ